MFQVSCPFSQMKTCSHAIPKVQKEKRYRLNFLKISVLESNYMCKHLPQATFCSKNTTNQIPSIRTTRKHRDCYGK